MKEQCRQCKITHDNWSVRNLMDDLHGIYSCGYCGINQSMFAEVKVEPQHLYTATDVKKVRAILQQEQGGLDLITKIPIPDNQACLDHSHTTQLVRGVLHRQTNAALGKLEGVYTRYLSYWYEGTLSDFLRQSADYLEREEDCRYYHPGWIKKVCTEFSKLNEAGKKSMLEFLGSPQGSNATERKKLFRKAVLSKKFTYEGLMKEIKERSKV